MAEIKPFAALRPAVDHVAAVSSPPYDVLDRDEVIAHIDGHPKSFLRVIRPDYKLEADAPSDDPRLIEVARDELAALESAGAMIRDNSPSLYLYELTLGEHVQLGLVAGVSCREYEEGGIKRHEHTRERELDGRTRHIAGVGANTGPVFMTYRACASVDSLLAASRDAAAPTYDFVADDGVRHRMWVLSDDAAVAELVERFAADVPALYIADGHHRSSASHAVWREHRDASGAPSAYDHFLGVLFPHDQVNILAYNRVLSDLGDYDSAGLLAALEKSFTVEPADVAEPGARGRFGMYLDGRWHRLTVRPELVPEGTAASLDADLLHKLAIEPLFGVTDIKTDPRISFVGGIRGAAELERRVDAEGGAAFFLHPVTLEDLMTISDEGGVMPPKSTWFEPKLRSGLVVRLLR